MAYAVSLADLRRAGIVFSADEIVAIADHLIHHLPADPPEGPFGPLAADRVRIVSDGSLACLGSDATPSVAELAILLQDLLGGSPRVPGGLRYAIARALHEVDAPPFDTLDEFWSALARFGHPRSDDTLRRILGRWDRRKPSQSTAELRQQLRDADRRLFEAQTREPIGRDTPRRPGGKGQSWKGQSWKGQGWRVQGWKGQRWKIGAALAGVVVTIAAASMADVLSPAIPSVPPPVPAATVRDEAVDPQPAPVHPQPVPVVHRATRAHTHPKQPVVRNNRTHAIRLRWLHTTIAFKDDLAAR
jgi:hypothetical protein